MVALILASWLTFSLSLSGALPNLFFAGLCWLLVSFHRDINDDFAKVIGRSESHRNVEQTKMKLWKIIRELSRVKELSANQSCGFFSSQFHDHVVICLVILDLSRRSIKFSALSLPIHSVLHCRPY